MNGRTYDQWKSRQKTKPKETTGTAPKNSPANDKNDEKR
jgi:hypothetical protein